MLLKDYLDRFCILPTHMARKMGFDPTKIFRIVRDGVLPSLAIALKIEDFTEGRVTPREIYNECLSIKEKHKKSHGKNQKEDGSQP